MKKYKITGSFEIEVTEVETKRQCRVTGALSPNVANIYTEDGMVNGQPCFTYLDDALQLWCVSYGGQDVGWVLSKVPGKLTDEERGGNRAAGSGSRRGSRR